MSELTTVARPYAKAAFEHALAVKALGPWADFLQFAAYAVNDAEMHALLDNPRVPQETRLAALLAVCEGRLPDGGKAFVEMLADNDRLSVLSEICALFLVEKARHEKTAEVVITSAAVLADGERKALTDALAKKWNKAVVATYEVDAALIGGVVIRGNDVVIDGSVRGKLNRLAETLRA
ncbi:F0F1 ATP synthase subunit delta [Permianibacter sp. IMCC34836]|uniref:F0F1 ATP synthase subunit delta n=1 Tax=Permianibacter fluminis TaxID=2738515 RepID=UPI0015560048|nr:F0F1 ATP synthase subunit delta [Permianibacter fluminis]NQD36051.1 F0F1 ATP synthase subunit delta [Permianibacter fluminis]